MAHSRFLWLGMHLSVVGGVLIFLAQSTAEDWRVEAACQGGAVFGSVRGEPGVHTIDVFVTYHVPGDGDWHPVPGASDTLNVSGPGPHDFGPLDVSATPAQANSIRVEIDVAGDPANAKSGSFKPCGAPAGTPTQPAETPTEPAGTPTEPAGTPTEPPATATQPPATATQPAPTATPLPEGTATATSQAAATATLISQVSGTVTMATPTPTRVAMVLGPPSSGDGGLLARHRTGATLVGVALIFLGMALVAGRGIADARRV